MTGPLVVDVPHTLGRVEARRRIEARLGDLAAQLPGGGSVSSRWTDGDRLEVAARAMGQDVSAHVDVGDAVVRVSLALPFMLSFFGGAAASAIRTKGAKLLAPKGRA